MTDENNVNEGTPPNEDAAAENSTETQSESVESKKPSDPVEQMVAKKVEESLKDIKSKLDNAYKARDDALTRLEAIETEKRQAEIDRLKEEGKHKEAYEKQLAEKERLLARLEEQNVNLTRDVKVRNSLSALDFRNKNAIEMAYKDIVGELVRNENGEWVHKSSGVSIEDYVRAYADSEDNSFLFKPKVSSGTGTQHPSTPSNSSDAEGKSLFAIPREKVFEMAEKGLLPHQKIK